MNKEHELYMREALKEADKALTNDEVPVGAVVVLQGKIIARGYNQVEMLNDSTAHAEIIALTSAYAHLGSKYLPADATLYVTLEPCVMCSGALYWSKIGNVVFGASDEKNGYKHICNASPFHPKTKLTEGILADECAKLMKDFFKSKR
jgi:tRNA(adenine34) deaminase